MSEAAKIDSMTIPCLCGYYLVYSRYEKNLQVLQGTAC